MNGGRGKSLPILKSGEEIILLSCSSKYCIKVSERELPKLIQTYGITISHEERERMRKSRKSEWGRNEKKWEGLERVSEEEMRKIIFCTFFFGNKVKNVRIFGPSKHIFSPDPNLDSSQWFQFSQSYWITISGHCLNHPSGRRRKEWITCQRSIWPWTAWGWNSINGWGKEWRRMTCTRWCGWRKTWMDERLGFDLEWSDSWVSSIRHGPSNDCGSGIDWCCNDIFRLVRWL